MSSIIRESLNQVIELQSERSIILTGFFLEQCEINELSSSLLPDEPKVGAVGRYKGVPVFDRSALSGRASGVSREGELNGVRYSFVQMDSVN